MHPDVPDAWNLAKRAIFGFASNCFSVARCQLGHLFDFEYDPLITKCLDEDGSVYLNKIVCSKPGDQFIFGVTPFPENRSVMGDLPGGRRQAAWQFVLHKTLKKFLEWIVGLGSRPNNIHIDVKVHTVCTRVK